MLFLPHACTFICRDLKYILMSIETKGRFAFFLDGTRQSVNIYHDINI